MTDKPDKPDAQQMSADDFFGDNDTSAQAEPSYNDIGDQLKDGLKQVGYQAGSNFVIQTIVNLLPLPYQHKRNITNKINRGEPIDIWDVIFGGLSIGRIIRWVIGGIIFIVVLGFMASRGLL